MPVYLICISTLSGVIQNDTSSNMEPGSNMEPEYEIVNDDILPNYADLELLDGVHNPLHFQYLTNMHSNHFDDATATIM